MTSKTQGQKPHTNYEFIKEWFIKAHQRCMQQRKFESAKLWADGLNHLECLLAERDRLRKACERALDKIQNDHLDLDPSGEIEEMLKQALEPKGQ